MRAAFLSSLALFYLVGASSMSQVPPQREPAVRMQIDRDIEYSHVGARFLRLDLYRREPNPAPSPVVVWIHGGGWSSGDKSPTPAAALVTSGFTVASIEYRLSGEAKFPAQIYDCKAGHSMGGYGALRLGFKGKVFGKIKAVAEKR